MDKPTTKRQLIALLDQAISEMSKLQAHIEGMNNKLAQSAAKAA